MRRGTLDSDIHCGEGRGVRRVHGRHARILGVQLHANEALVSWSGAVYKFFVKAN